METPKINISLDQKIKDGYLLHIKDRGLYVDVLNSWLQAKSVYSEAGTDNLVQIPTYEERIKDREGDYAEFVISNSDKAKILEFNEFVQLFNNELPSIKETHNFKRANEIAQLVFDKFFQ